MNVPVPSRFRRFAVATAGIVAAALLLRGQIAEALVARGDEFLSRGQSAASLRYYRRATRIDAGNALAVDRLLFVAMMLRNREALADGIESASRYLSRHPGDDLVRLDRAMAYRAVGARAPALGDFAVVGQRTRDARALTFAGFAAKDLGDIAYARRLWRAAISIEPGFPAARHSLARLGERP